MAFTVSRSGQVNAAGNTRALFLELYGGEVLTAMRKHTDFWDYHTVKQLSGAKAHRFPRSGRTTASYHTAGEQVTTNVINHAELTLTPDEFLVSASFIPEIDEALEYWDRRGEYAYQHGEAIAQQFDKNVGAMFIAAARASNEVTDLPGGTTINNAAMKTDASVIAAAMFTAGDALYEKYVKTNVTAFFKPAQYSLLVQNTDLINKDWGGSGAFASGDITMINGIPIRKANNLPTTNVTGTYGNKYNIDASVTAGIIVNPRAAATVMVRDITPVVVNKDDYLGDILMAKALVGHGTYEVEGAVELRTGNPA